jgi:NADH-quinone oxidoreductase subunit N
MTPLPYLQLLHLSLPQVALDVTALVVLFTDLALRGRSLRFRFSVAAGIASTGCFLAIVRLLTAPVQVNLFDGMFVLSLLTSHVQVALLVFTIVTLLLSIDTEFTEHVGEFVALVLLALTGMMFLVSTQNLLVTFLSLELLSLALYALAGFDSQRPRSAEAALKYFLFGGISAAFMLYGFSLLYGIANSTNYAQIGVAIGRSGMTPVVMIAVVASILGFGFKVAAVPLHFWSPDVYEAAPNPVAGFIASSSKIASFFAFFTLMTLCFGAVEGGGAWRGFHTGWVPVVAVIAALSMVLGNLGALAQRGFRRLMAYSAIAHTGYMLIALVSHRAGDVAALLYYVATYSASVLGTFAVIHVIEQQEGDDLFSRFDGLSRRAPVLSACLFLFLLSQAGVPPLAGFFAKFYIFAAALHGEGGTSLLWLVLLALAMSAVSLFYYLQVLKRVYVSEPTEITGPIRVPKLATFVIVLLACAVVLAGALPEPLIQWFRAAM